MLTMINTNQMRPPIAPIGLDYVTTAARAAKIETDVLDLCLEDNPDLALTEYFKNNSPDLVGLSFRNTDDCFWPSASWFIPNLMQIVESIRAKTDAPIVGGGVGFSIFAEQIVEHSGIDFGIHGDGEGAIVELYKQVRNGQDFQKVPGLVWRDNGRFIKNSPNWPAELSIPTSRDSVNNYVYFKKGGQCGIETKRGCNQKCIYCADPLSKGTCLRLRKPSEVADEIESLIAQGVEVFHICDSEFNIPRHHALAVCREMIKRSLGEKVSWYTYMVVVPFDAELAEAMKQAGCAGIDFTGDTISPKMLKVYRQSHNRDDMARAVKLCRDNNITVMIDLLFGGPGETAETIAETINFIKQVGPDCAGAPLGLRVYPGTEMAEIVKNEGPMEDNPNIKRKYSGPVDLFKPTFYIESKLGKNPASIVKQLVDSDPRFFEPMEDFPVEDLREVDSRDHNYNDNSELVSAIEKGATGAYWHILHKMRTGKGF